MAKFFGNFLRTVHPLRKDGTELKLNNRLYHFRPNILGHYVCEVLDPNDRQSILTISAGYQPYTPTDDEIVTLTAADAGVVGVDTGELPNDAKEKDAANARAGQLAAPNVPMPPKQPEAPNTPRRAKSEATA